MSKDENPIEIHYPINTITMIDGEVLKVKKLIESYTDAYRVVLKGNRIKLVFFHAIKYVDNGEQE